MKKENISLGIVVIGYKNTVGMSRLLSSLSNAEYPLDNIKLIISIDYSGDNSVEKVAEDFKWNFGEKIIKAYDTNLGLRTHILKCGDYIKEYNLDALIALEDDIYVAPNFFVYSLQACKTYKDNSKIAGIALYKHEINLFAKHPFIEYKDDGDVFFIQYAMSWGQIWLKKQWEDFKNWLEKEEWKNIDSYLIPDNIKQWNNSWLKYHIMYCIAKNKFFVYPRVSLTTNFTDVGAHNTFSTSQMQVPLDFRTNKVWKFNDINNSKSVYDAFFENLYIKKILNYKDCVIDLNGVKPIDTGHRYILTRKKLNYKIVKTWGLQFRPIELNIILECEGNEIFLYDMKYKESNNFKRNLDSKYVEYDLKGLDIVNINSIKFLIIRFFQKLDYKIKNIRK